LQVGDKVLFKLQNPPTKLLIQTTRSKARTWLLFEFPVCFNFKLRFKSCDLLCWLCSVLFLTNHDSLIFWTDHEAQISN
jgi:hypothetical protein